MASLNLGKERLALIVGLLAGLSMLAYLNWAGSQAQSKIDETLRLVGSRKQVLIARRHVRAGERLSSRDITYKSLVGQDVESGALSKTSRAIGQTVSQDIFAGEQVLASHLGQGSKGRAAGALAPGKMAVAMTRDDIAAAPTGIVPGDTVDVFGFDNGGSYGRSLKQLLVRGIGGTPPFALSRTLVGVRDMATLEQGGAPGQGDIIVEVKNWQAAALSEMAEAGKLRVSLRSFRNQGGDH